MYTKGMTTRDIQAHLLDIYGYEFSPESISHITDKVLERAKEWQNRPLQDVLIFSVDGLTGISDVPHIAISPHSYT